MLNRPTLRPHSAAWTMAGKERLVLCGATMPAQTCASKLRVLRRHVANTVTGILQRPQFAKPLQAGTCCTASKRLAGWTRDGSVEEIGGWMLEAQRLNREAEAKKRKLQDAIEKESGKDARLGNDSMDGLDGSLSS